MSNPRAEREENFEDMKLIRTFHPVGHGAFYTERFYDDHERNVANVVFDCGCYERAKKGQQRRDFEKEIGAVVDNEFPIQDDKISVDALFISHFHEDHINGISKLLQNCHVKRIFMPKLTDGVFLDIFLYMIVVHRRTPSIALNTIVRFVNLINDLKIEVDIDDEEITEDGDFHNVDISEVCVGSLISKPTIISVYNIWKYIPFSTREKKSLLINELVKDVPELTPALTGQAIDFKQIADEITANPNLLKKCKRVYNGVFGDKKHNRYSMTLFSGTCDKFTTCSHRCHQGVVDLPRYCTKNCLYMGDFEADPNKSIKNTNCEQLLKFYDRYWAKIGLFQVPHHGSHDNTNVKLYSPPKLGIISAGKEDVYLNPHVDVIHLLQQHNCVPLIVTEDPTTIQKFYYKIK